MIRDMNLLPQMEEEVADICDNLNWVCKPLHPYPEIPLKGFQFHPKGSEPVWLTFLNDGNLADPVFFVLKDQPCEPPNPKNKYWLNTITQFAGMDAHIAMMNLLKYVSHKYFKVFELIDESDYWETGDLQICRYHFDEFGKSMDEMAHKLAALDGQYGLSGASVQKRIEDLLHSRGLMEILKALQ
jgi:hypothetical protein